MTSPRGNRFEDFFADDAYVALKNFLYNYLLRKRAIEACLRGDEKGLILEIGSGLSPTVAESGKVVYSELSFSALRTLKNRQRMGFYVVADATHLPFKTASFSHVVCSEVYGTSSRGSSGLPGDGCGFASRRIPDPDLSPSARLFCL